MGVTPNGEGGLHLLRLGVSGRGGECFTVADNAQLVIATVVTFCALYFSTYFNAGFNRCQNTITHAELGV
jgi:hypothetical protein